MFESIKAGRKSWDHFMKSFLFLFQPFPLLLHSQKSSLLEIIEWEFRPDSYRDGTLTPKI
jgi:hypothetical protein